MVPLPKVSGVLFVNPVNLVPLPKVPGVRSLNPALLEGVPGLCGGFQTTAGEHGDGPLCKAAFRAQRDAGRRKRIGMHTNI